jgi:hypothetical protein
MNSMIDAQMDGNAEALDSFNLGKTLISIQVNFSFFFLRKKFSLYFN